MDTPYVSHSGYFDRAFGNIDVIAADLGIALDGVEYDTMIGTGLSGTLVVPTLARAHGKYWAIVRKESSPHSSSMIEGTIGQKWIFVDDFVSSGATRNRVKDAIASIRRWNGQTDAYGPIPTTYVGTYEYERNSFISY